MSCWTHALTVALLWPSDDLFLGDEDAVFPIYRNVLFQVSELPRVRTAAVGAAACRVGHNQLNRGDEGLSLLRLMAFIPSFAI